MADPAVNRPLRVLWLGHGAERTGPPIYLLRLLEGLRSVPDIAPSVVLLDGGPLLGEIAALAPTRVVGAGGGGVARRAVAAGLSRAGSGRGGALLAPERHWPDGRPDVVVVNTAGSVRALDALPEAPARLVGHVHELATGLDYWLDPAWRTRLFATADQLWVVADAVGDHLVEEHGIDRARLRVHRGVLPADALGPVDGAARRRRRLELGVGPNAVLIGASGTLDWRKAPDLFLEVARRTAEAAAAEVVFLWVGGDRAGPWGRVLAAAPDSPRVEVLGEVDRPDRWFGALDLFALVAREDAYPLVCLEAAAAGVPAVAFDAGGAPELYREGGGRVVAYPDVAAFAAALAALADDPAARAAEGARARAAAAAHTVEAALPALIADLRAVAGR